jgi:SAM-dependent methyltransferase
MSQSVSLTKEALKAQAHHFRSFERLLELELSGLTNDSRYELNFSRLVKPDPFRLFDVKANTDLPFMLGTDQRDHLVPLVAERLAPLRSGGLVLDIGAGDGQSTAATLQNRNEPLSLLPLDPAAGALQRYQDLFASQLPHIVVPRTLAIGIDDWVSAEPDSEIFSEDHFDTIVAIHSLYFTADLSGFLHRAYDRLLPGGKMLIVFAECDGRFSGRLAKDYREHNPVPSNSDHPLGGDGLDRLFGVLDPSADRSDCEAALRDHLDGDLFRVVEIVRQPTRLFGHDLGDIIACGFLTSLSPSDDEELGRQIRYISSRLQDEPETFDLRLSLAGPRARMLSVAQPQIFIELEKR